MTPRYIFRSEFKPGTAILFWEIVDSETREVVAAVNSFDGMAAHICELLNAKPLDAVEDDRAMR